MLQCQLPFECFGCLQLELQPVILKPKQSEIHASGS